MKPACLTAIVLLVGSAAISACQDPSIEATSPPEASPPPGRAEKTAGEVRRSAAEIKEPSPEEQQKLIQQQSRMIEQIWWNQEDVVKNLGLKKRQRRRMDELFQAFLENRQGLREHQRQAAEDYYARLGSGDWDEARNAAERIANAAAVQVSAQPRMKVEVLSLLSTEQFALFRQHYPNLFRQPWIRRMPMGSRPRASGGQRPLDQMKRQSESEGQGRTP